MSEIYGALAAVMTDVDHVAKRDVNQHQRFNFRGVDAVVNAVGPVLRKHRVVVTPSVQDVQYDAVSTSTGKPATACRVLVDYIFYAADGSHISTRVAAESWDNGDKAAPKAMSVAFRTALLQALALPTDEPDPDSQTYERDHAPTPAPRRDGSRRPAPGPISDKQVAAIAAMADKLGLTREQKIAGVSTIASRPVDSTKDLTREEASRVIDSLKQKLPAEDAWPEATEPGVDQ